VGLRQSEVSTPSSELVRRRIAALVLERQTLHERRATEILLEQNRLDIVRAQHELANALVSEHGASSAA